MIMLFTGERAVLYVKLLLHITKSYFFPVLYIDVFYLMYFTVYKQMNNNKKKYSGNWVLHE